METQQARPIQTSITDPRQARVLLMLAGLLAAALAVFLIVWFVGRDGSSPVTLPQGGPSAVSEAQLQKLASTVGHPVYWAGAKKATYELTRTSDGRIYVRYLPSSAKVGNRSAKYLTIGTYPEQHAFRSIRRAAARPGAISLKIDHGGLLVFNRAAPKSVYFGYPGAKYQVEVYDPSPAQARALVVGGRITPIR